MMMVGAAGLSLFALALAQKHGLELNEDMITIGLETSKYGLILWLMYKASVVFL
jgi:hypothetical protein